MEMNTYDTERIVLEPNGIGQYISFDSCPRYLKCQFDDEGEEDAQAWEEAFNPLSILLSGEGQSFEHKTRARLASSATAHYDPEAESSEGASTDAETPGEGIDTIFNSWSDVDDIEDNFNQTVAQARSNLAPVLDYVAEMAATDAPVLLSEVLLAGGIAEWPIGGYADLIIFWPQVGNRVSATVAELKASWKEKTSHQLQATAYVQLLEQIFMAAGYEPDIDATVIHRETEVNELDRESLSKFDVEPRLADLQRLLGPDGPIIELLGDGIQGSGTPMNEVDYQLNLKCDSCIYNESCIYRAVEKQSTRLLGISIGEQQALAAEGITKLDQLAAVLEPPEYPRYPRPDKFREFDVHAEHEETVEALRQNPTVGDKLEILVVRARAMLEELAEDPDLGYNGSRPPMYEGTGYGTLPSDNPKGWADWDSGELVRIYLHVEWDYMRDRIAMVSGRVNSTDFGVDGGLKFEKLTSELADDEKKSLEEERNLLLTFFDKLFDAIEMVSEHAGREEDAPMHIYLYSPLERDQLIEAIRRHPELAGAEEIRDLFGFRDEIDQAMVSTLQDEIDNRVAVRYPVTGLVPVAEHMRQRFHGGSDWLGNEETDGADGWFGDDDWKVSHDASNIESGPTNVDLRRVFYHEFFNYESRYEYEDGELELQLDSTESTYNYYPSRARFGSQIPLEYVWAARDCIDESWLPKSVVENREDDYWTLKRFTHHDHIDQETEMRPADVEALGRRLCAALEHVERSIGYKSSMLNKTALQFSAPEEWTLERRTLEESSGEYLDLEYGTSRQKGLQRFAKPIRQRVLDGRTAVITVDEIRHDEEGILVDGQFAYGDDGLDFPVPEHVVNNCRLKEPRGTSSGSWLVASEARENENGLYTEEEATKPKDIECGTPAKIKSLDNDDGTITIRFGVFDKHSPDDNNFRRLRYGVNHRTWTVREHTEENDVLTLEERENPQLLVLDEQTDDLPATRASHVLEKASDNELAEVLETLLDGDTPAFDGEFTTVEDRRDVTSWLHAFDEERRERLPNDQVLFPPKGGQGPFILSEGSRLVGLQGPPGTGKSGGALANAIVAHAHARSKQNEPFRALVTAPSNKAIEEVLEKVAERVSIAATDPEGVNTLSDLRLVRATGRYSEDADSIERVKRLNYNDEPEAVADLAGLFTPRKGAQAGLEAFGANSDDPVIVFATPTSTYGLVNKMAGEFGYEDTKEMAEEGQTLFNFLTVDEASMLQVPSLLLCGALLERDMQVLIAGDHRQMPPVQEHDWENEDRRPIEAKVPYLSALNLLRFINGKKELEHTPNPEGAGVAMENLDRTFRCHPEIAGFLREWIYNRLDDVEYESDRRGDDDLGIAPAETDDEPMATIMDPTHPLVLILHDEEQSQQSNAVEVSIAEALLAALPGEESGGVVTPHNAQRGFLRSRTDEEVDIDTVERFQGGQKDFITVSATVSDPEYARQEREFILSPNRLNVAMSRMKDKLIVIAGKSLFRIIPREADEYEDAMVWRGLHQYVGAGGKNPLFEGSLADFTDSEVMGINALTDVNIRVYSSHETD